MYINANPWDPIKEAAARRVDAFLKRTPNNSSHFLCLGRDKVGAGLRERVYNPGRIRQGPAGLCGPAALLFDLASRDPDTYARFGIELFEQGWSRIKKFEIKPNQALKIAMTPAGMNQADWLTMASIRNSKNTPLFDYDAPSGSYNQFKGITLPGEMTKWLKEIGYSEVEEKTSLTKFISMDDNNASRASSRFEEDWTVFLFINANMLNFHTEHLSGTTADHWVELRSKIQLTEQSVKFKVFSWGKGDFEVPTANTVPPPVDEDDKPIVERQPLHSFTKKMFLQNYYGYIAARF
jgi:hypothetical protein